MTMQQERKFSSSKIRAFLKRLFKPRNVIFVIIIIIILIVGFGLGVAYATGENGLALKGFMETLKAIIEVHRITLEKIIDAFKEYLKHI